MPCPPPGDLPYPGIEPASLMSPALAGKFFTTSATWPHPINQKALRTKLGSFLAVQWVRALGLHCMADLPHSSVGKETACNSGDPSSIPGPGRSPGEEIGYPLQYSWASLVAQLERNCLQCGRLGSVPGLGRSPGEGIGYPLQYSWASLVA